MVAFWFLVLVSVWGVFACVGLLVFFSPSSCRVSFPFNDDLGTPPTWRPHSWKKNLWGNPCRFHLQLKLRIEVPLWRNVADARHPPVDPPSDESDMDSEATAGSKERSPRYAQPVPVGEAEPQEAEAKEATEGEDIVEEPTYTFAQGYGRFVIRYTRLATALGNFEQGNVQAASAVVAHWLTSGLGIAMSRIGWNLLSPRHAITRLPSQTLANYCYSGYPLCREEDRLYRQYGHIAYPKDPLRQKTNLSLNLVNLTNSSNSFCLRQQNFCLSQFFLVV